MITVYSIDRFTSQFPQLLLERDVFILKAQWTLYQLECVDESRVKEVQIGQLHRFDYYWSKIFQIPSSSGDRTYLSKVVKSCLSFPKGNANVERTLSDNANTLALEDTNLKEETLMALRPAKAFGRDIAGAQIKG